MNLSVAIQTHPARAELTARLRDAVGGDVDVVVDPDPGAALPSPWRTYRQALEETPPDATHRLVLQDDATVCDGFRAAADAAAKAQPDRVIVFFVGGRPTDHARTVYAACDRDLPFAELRRHTWLPVVAACWPSAMIPRLLDFVDAQGWRGRLRADDEVVGRFLRHEKILPLATVPSLVQHGDVHPSLVGRRALAGADPGRVAACWIGECESCDASEIDWTLPPYRG